MPEKEIVETAQQNISEADQAPAAEPTAAEVEQVAAAAAEETAEEPAAFLKEFENLLKSADNNEDFTRNLSALAGKMFAKVSGQQAAERAETLHHHTAMLARVDSIAKSLDVIARRG